MDKNTSSPVAPFEPQFDLTTPSASAPPAIAPASAPAAAPPSPFTSTSHTQAPAEPKKEGIVGLLAALGLLLFKAKGLLGLFKFGKVFTTLATMLASIWVYALQWGWKFAAGFVLLILVHEMGHVLAARVKKIPVSAPMFIPGLGALITLKENPRDAFTEAYIAYGGPLLGTIGATAVWGLASVMDSPLLLSLATTALMLNLFNLIPVSPLDGGRITAALSPHLWLLGLVGLLVWFLMTHSPIMFLILILGAFRLWGSWKGKDQEYYQVSPGQRWMVAVLYVGLAVYLGWSQHYTHQVMEAWLNSRGTTL